MYNGVVRRGSLVVLLVQLLVGCHRAPVDVRLDAGAEKESLTQLRDQARLLLESHCGECHIQGYPTARAGALRVFDLMEADWSAPMTEAQLRNALWRLGELLDEHANPRNVSESDRAIFKRFVDAEVERRQTLGQGEKVQSGSGS